MRRGGVEPPGSSLSAKRSSAELTARMLYYQPIHARGLSLRRGQGLRVESIGAAGRRLARTDAQAHGGRKTPLHINFPVTESKGLLLPGRSPGRRGQGAICLGANPVHNRIAFSAMVGTREYDSR